MADGVKRRGNNRQAVALRRARQPRRDHRQSELACQRRVENGPDDDVGIAQFPDAAFSLLIAAQHAPVLGTSPESRHLPVGVHNASS